jgi:hypothetical protein
MTKFLVLLFFVPLFWSQPKYQVQKIWLFSKTQYSGNVPKDADGKELKGYTTSLLCFLEVSKSHSSPAWQTAYFDANKYLVSMVPIAQDSVIAGSAKNTNTPIVIKAAPGTRLVQLNLTDQGNYKGAKTQGFVLEGILNKKHVHLKSNEPIIELSPVLMQ